MARIWNAPVPPHAPESQLRAKVAAEQMRKEVPLHGAAGAGVAERFTG